MKNEINIIVKSLYIHIPFCDHICIYCDFYKMIANADKQNEYIKYLIKELESRKEKLKNVKTIYIGGGTPSSLSISNLELLFDKLNEIINLKNLKEFSFECNPSDVNIELINILKKYYVNRVSLGVQSFDDHKLSFIGRNHNKDIAIKAIKLLQDNAITNINCDLIFGFDFDNINLVKNDIDIINNLDIPHISIYSLIIEDKTILNHLIKKEYHPMEDDKEAEIFGFVCDYLKENGYIHYEISNFCKKGYESLHNLCYWDYDNYIGVGANASGKIDNIRYTNINNLNKYYEGIDNNNFNYYEYLELDNDDLMDEFIMMGLRKINGISINEFKKRFNCDIIDIYKNIPLLINQELLISDKGYLKIPEDKIYISNFILQKIFE